MKGQSKPTKSLKKFLGNMLANLIGKSEADYQAKVKQFHMPSPELTPFKMPKKRAKCTSKYAKHKPNPAKKSRKPCYGGMPHLTQPRGFMAGHAPTIDQVKALEKRIGLKVQVKNGECFVGDSGFKVPVNATLDEATRLLDEYLASEDSAWADMCPVPAPILAGPDQYHKPQPEGA